MKADIGTKTYTQMIIAALFVIAHYKRAIQTESNPNLHQELNEKTNCDPYIQWNTIQQ